MSISQKALWIIERNIEGPLTLPGLAESCGVSRSHLAHAFKAATGMPVMAYWRGRRLSLAAEDLARGAPDILTVALNAGYASHEAFTRAFSEQFGATPEAVRTRGAVNGLALVGPPEATFEAAMNLAPPRTVDDRRILAVGLKERIEGDGHVRIPALWQRFSAFMEAVPAKRQAMPISVTQAVEETCAFDYLAALEVDRVADLPSGLTSWDIPASRYAVFEHARHVAQLPLTYRAIWDEALPSTGLKAADRPILERHKRSFDPRTGEGGVEIWIPLDAAKAAETGAVKTAV